eukprot:scaffold1988_cov270-Prasinococcus_capsulatus_cf.AAC.8
MKTGGGELSLFGCAYVRYRPLPLAFPRAQSPIALLCCSSVLRALEPIQLDMSPPPCAGATGPAGPSSPEQLFFVPGWRPERGLRSGASPTATSGGGEYE